MLLYKNFTTTELMDIDNSSNPKVFVTEILEFLKQHPEYSKSQRVRDLCESLLL